MALAGSSGACYRSSSTIPTAVALDRAYTRHMLVIFPTAPSTARVRVAGGTVGSAQNPHDLFNWDHTVAALAGAHQHRTGGGAYNAVKYTALPTNTWVSLGVTCDGTTMRAYLDGTLNATAAAGGFAAGNAVEVQMLAGLIAGGGIDGSSQFAEGAVAEFAVWNAVLSADEMRALGQRFRAPRVRPQSLQFYAPAIRALVDARGGRTLSRVAGTDAVVPHPAVR